MLQGTSGLAVAAQTLVALADQLLGLFNENGRVALTLGKAPPGMARAFHDAGKKIDDVQSVRETARPAQRKGLTDAL